MSALTKLKGLMKSLKVIEHDRWDTAAHAVLELEHKLGQGDAATAAADPKAAEEVAALRSEVAGLREQVEKLAPLLQVVEEANRAPQPAARALLDNTAG